MQEKIIKYTLGETDIFYVKNKDNSTGLLLYPSVLNEQPNIDCLNCDSMIQVKFIDDAHWIEFSQGLTMRNSVSVHNICITNQILEEENENISKIITFLSDRRGNEYIHTLKYFKNCNACEIFIEYINNSSELKVLELFSSFSVSGIKVMTKNEFSTNGLILHRLRSYWSTEGRCESAPFESYGLEQSWGEQGARCERFGQIGSMPVRKFFPFVAIEDKNNNVVWAAQIFAPSTWQMEVYTISRCASLSGGLGDKEFGHWQKNILPGEKFSSLSAYVTVCMGNIDDACNNLVSIQEEKLTNLPKSEEHLPIIFNEYCTSWGNPSQENVIKIVDFIKDIGVDYFVIDAGWYSVDGKGWLNTIGDWIPNEKLFPKSIKYLADYIRNKGMVPGIWFELEVCACDSEIYKNLDMLLKCDGIPINAKRRRFLDLRMQNVKDYLRKKVMNFIKDKSFGYIKIDYNDSIGIGCDGAESYGEALRQIEEESINIFNKLKREIPELIIENCSSGGHRLEPYRMSKSSMASFSDAHECIEIPIIAANVSRVIPARQNQIWATLRKNDTLDRIVYSIVATFFGRLCLSGDITELNGEQLDKVRDGIRFYKSISHIIKNGRFFKLTDDVKYYRRPTGYQAVKRITKEKDEFILIFHTFKLESKSEIVIDIEKGWRLKQEYSNHIDFDISNGRLTINHPSDFVATCFYFVKNVI